MAASASKAMQELESYEREVRQCIQDLDTQVYKLESDHLVHTSARGNEIRGWAGMVDGRGSSSRRHGDHNADRIYSRSTWVQGTDGEEDDQDDDVLAGLTGLQMSVDDQFGSAGLAPSGGVGDDDDDDDVYDDPDFDASRTAASSQGMGDGGSDGEDGDGNAGSRRSGRKRTRKAFGEE